MTTPATPNAVAEARAAIHAEFKARFIAEMDANRDRIGQLISIFKAARDAANAELKARLAALPQAETETPK